MGAEAVGFARVITDRAAYGYIGDAFITPSQRGRGLSKRLMAAIMEHPQLQGFRRWSLGVTNDAHGLYRQFGFRPLANPQRYMEIVNPNVYLGTVALSVARQCLGIVTSSFGERELRAVSTRRELT